MGIAGMVTPCRRETFQKLVLNAGAFLMNWDYSQYQTAAEMKAALKTVLKDENYVLGATRGGGTFVVSGEIREPDVDGKRYRFKGGAFVDSVDAYLGGTLVEIRPDNFAKVLATGEVETSGVMHTLTMHTAIQDADYIPHLIWVGDVSGGGLIIIDIANALNNNGVTLTFNDKNEATVPFEMHAYQEDVEDYDYAPFKVIWVDELGAIDCVITPQFKEMTAGDTLVLTTVTNPAGGTIAWASDETAVATVSNGTVTAVAAGTATIKATYTKSGESAVGQMVVRVKAAS